MQRYYLDELVQTETATSVFSLCVYSTRMVVGSNTINSLNNTLS